MCVFVQRNWEMDIVLYKLCLMSLYSCVRVCVRVCAQAY